MTKLKVLEFTYTKKALHIEAIGMQICNMVMVKKAGQMELSMKEVMSMGKNKVKVNSYGQMDQLMKVASTTMI